MVWLWWLLVCVEVPFIIELSSIYCILVVWLSMALIIDYSYQWSSFFNSQSSLTPQQNQAHMSHHVVTQVTVISASSRGTLNYFFWKNFFCKILCRCEKSVNFAEINQQWYKHAYLSDVCKYAKFSCLRFCAHWLTWYFWSQVYMQSGKNDWLIICIPCVEIKAHAAWAYNILIVQCNK